MTVKYKKQNFLFAIINVEKFHIAMEILLNAPHQLQIQSESIADSAVIRTVLVMERGDARGDHM